MFITKCFTLSSVIYIRLVQTLMEHFEEILKAQPFKKKNMWYCLNNVTKQFVVIFLRPCDLWPAAERTVTCLKHVSSASFTRDGDVTPPQHVVWT